MGRLIIDARDAGIEKINFQGGPGGVINTDITSKYDYTGFNEGELILLTAYVKTGYSFTGWEVNDYYPYWSDETLNLDFWGDTLTIKAYARKNSGGGGSDDDDEETPKAYIYATKNGKSDWYPATPYIYTNGKWNKAIPYIYNGSWK